jgi:hypothetical protein
VRRGRLDGDGREVRGVREPEAVIERCTACGHRPSVAPLMLLVPKDGKPEAARGAACSPACVKRLSGPIVVGSAMDLRARRLRKRLKRKSEAIAHLEGVTTEGGPLPESWTEAAD